MSVMELMSKRDYCASALPLRRTHASNQYPVFGLVGVLGVLAFIFSAVSPTDDSVQQEYVQGSKGRYCIVRNYKSIHSVHGTLVNPNYGAIVPRSLGSFCCSAVGSVRIFYIKFDATIFSIPIADRSPPTRSSRFLLNS